jgi:hypothetical protein
MVFKFKGWKGNLYLFSLGFISGPIGSLVIGILRYVKVVEFRLLSMNGLALVLGAVAAVALKMGLTGLAGRLAGPVVAPVFGGSEAILRGGVATVV